MDIIGINQPFGKMKYIERRSVMNIRGLTITPPSGGLYIVLDYEGRVKTQNGLRNNVLDETKNYNKYEIFFVSRSKIKERGCIENIGKYTVNVPFDVTFCLAEGGEKQFIRTFSQRDKYTETDVYNNIRGIIISSIKTVLANELKNGIEQIERKLDEITIQCKNRINDNLIDSQKGIEINELVLEINESEDLQEPDDSALKAKIRIIDTQKEMIEIKKNILADKKAFTKGGR